ncbi:TetR family transcriptional regulator [Alkalibacter mobilis]|uniref:TetR family transcriptional regulator n=1 Tax=Alkalibacter mobilis TaxID=2787712 RepID=UPI00189DFA57|nr:TetR family transcriptional regulator [Alkalibacter mobilis]MBF7097198.1 TetR family transcriptional regulator [Alkalibacter mobilis]
MTLTSKKDLLLNAAISLIQKNGFEKTSVSQIVNEAGVAQGTFYLYFKSKNSLVSAIAKMIFEEQLSNIKDAYSELDKDLNKLLKTMIHTTFDITEKYKDMISFLYSGFAYDKTFDTWEEIYRPYYTWVEEILSDFQSENWIHSKCSVSNLANFVIGLIEHGAENFFMTTLGSNSVETVKNDLLIFLTDSLNVNASK